MELKGISGQNIQVRRIKDEANDMAVKASLQNNGQDEIVVETDTGRYAISGQDLDVHKKIGLPAPGAKVDFGGIVGQVLFSDDEPAKAGRPVQDKALRAISEPPSADDAAKTMAWRRQQDEALMASETARHSKVHEEIKAAGSQELDTAANTTSIYGETPSLEDVKEWSSVNPELIKSPALKRVSDYNRDGSVSPEELHKAIQRKVVVINGVDSLHYPGAGKPATATETAGNPPAKLAVSSEQEAFYKRMNQRAKTEDTLKAIEGGAIVTGAVLEGVLKTLFPN